MRAAGGRFIKLLRSTLVFSAMTFLSRIAGFARDMLQATLFGTGGAMSAFIVAYRIPNFLRRVFAEGSMQMAFVPVLNEIRESGDRERLRDFIDHMAGSLAAVVFVVAGIGVLAAPLIATVFTPGALDEPEKFALTAEMLRITFPYLIFISLMALCASVLNSYGKFGLAAFTPVLHNITVIAAMLLLAPQMAVPPKALAWGVLVAGFLQLALLWPALIRLGLRPRFKLGFHHAEVRRVGKLMLPTLFSSSVAQVNLLVGTVFASLLADGSQDWLYYSDRLIEFPLGLFGVAIGTVILPHLARRFAAQDHDGYSHSLDWGLRLVLLVGWPAGLGLMFLAEPITATVYNYGRFTAHDTQMAAWSLIAMSIGVPAFMASKVLLPAFYARQDTKTPMRAALWTVASNVGLTLAIVTPLALNHTLGGHAGIALATGLAGIVNALWLFIALRRQQLFAAQPGWPAYLSKLIVAGLTMVATLLALRAFIGDWSLLHWQARILWLLTAIAAGASAYGLVLLALGLRPRHLRDRG